MGKSDPLLEPFRIKHLHFKNRVLSTAHEPYYTLGGQPLERYRLYHEEKAKGGLALTMIGGSAVVSPDWLAPSQKPMARPAARTIRVSRFFIVRLGRAPGSAEGTRGARRYEGARPAAAGTGA